MNLLFDAHIFFSQMQDGSSNAVNINVQSK